MTSTSLRRSTLASAMMVALAAGVVSERAAAAVYAGALLETTDLSLTITGGVSALSYTLDSGNEATLNNVDDDTAGLAAQCTGTTIPTFTGSCGDDPALDPNQAFVTDSGVTKPGENDFTLAGPTPDQSYARADSVIESAQVTGDDRTVAKNVAEAEVTTRDSIQQGDATSEISSDTSFTFQFELLETGTLVLDFDAAPQLWVDITTDAGEYAIARASIEWFFDLSFDGDDGSTVRWEPQGTAVSDCLVTDEGSFAGVACEENNDQYDLNISRQRSSIPSSLSYNPGTGNFGITITGLPAGTYTLVFNETKDVSVTNGVPAPGILSLLGAGLVGIGWSRRRRA